VLILYRSNIFRSAKLSYIRLWPAGFSRLQLLASSGLFHISSHSIRSNPSQCLPIHSKNHMQWSLQYLTISYLVLRTSRPDFRVRDMFANARKQTFVYDRCHARYRDASMRHIPILSLPLDSHVDLQPAADQTKCGHLTWLHPWEVLRHMLGRFVILGVVCWDHLNREEYMKRVADGTLS